MEIKLFQFSKRKFSLSVSILWAETYFNKNVYSLMVWLCTFIVLKDTLTDGQL
jgi:hypothetical protein